MDITRDTASLRAGIEALRASGKSIGFVPTMGALHEGHLALVKLAKSQSDSVIVSIFVNPTQFGPGEDFARYPRPEEADLKKLQAMNVDIAFLPTKAEIYPNGEEITVKAGKEAEILCGKSRPRHFDGVLTVVKRLLELVTPDIAIFGEKDFQQLFLINQMVNNYDIPVKIMGHPVVREEGGLALSSRNQYLSPDDRIKALEIHRNLQEIAEGKLTLEKAGERLERQGFSIDYLEIRDEETLALADTPQKGTRIFIAATISGTRLIDNLPA